MIKRYKKNFLLVVLALVLIPGFAYATDGGPRLINKAKARYKAADDRSKPKFAKQVRRQTVANKGKQGAVQKSPQRIMANYSDLVMDAKTGRILHATNPDELRYPASLTKMMTLYMTFQALKSGKLKLNDALPVSHNASIQEPSKLGLRPGQQIRVEDALLGMAIKSANDATVVLAEALGGSSEGFASMMTQKARDLGMTRTVFRNPSGLPNPGQVTTARDMAVLGYALIYHFPQFYPYFSREQFKYAGISHRNHNKLMSRYQGMDGIKTGYIRASGFNLVASTVRGSTRLIAVVLGGRSSVERNNRMAALLDQSFAQIQNGQPGRRVKTADSGETNTAVDYVSVPTMIPVEASTRSEQVVVGGVDQVAKVVGVDQVAKVEAGGSQLTKLNSRSHYNYTTPLSLSFVGVVGILIFLKQRRYPYFHG